MPLPALAAMGLRAVGSKAIQSVGSRALASGVAKTGVRGGLSQLSRSQFGQNAAHRAMDSAIGRMTAPEQDEQQPNGY